MTIGTLLANSALAALAALSSGCFAHIVDAGPRADPAPRLSRLPESPGPVPRGQGRVVLDSVDGPAEVSEITDVDAANSAGFADGVWASASSVGVHTKFVCQTPCIVDLPRGDHRLLFAGKVHDHDASTTVIVRAGSHPHAYRAALGYEDQGGSEFAPAFLETLGVVALIAGGAAMGAAQTDSDPGDARTARKVGIASLAGGAAAFGLGIAIDFAGRGEKREGSYVRWSLAPSPGLVRVSRR